MHSGPVSTMALFPRHPEVREHCQIAAESESEVPEGEINDFEAMDKWGIA